MYRDGGTGGYGKEYREGRKGMGKERIERGKGTEREKEGRRWMRREASHARTTPC